MLNFLKSLSTRKLKVLRIVLELFQENDEKTVILTYLLEYLNLLKVSAVPRFIMGIDFFDPVGFAKQLNSARAHKDSEVWILKGDLYVPWFSKKLPDMQIEWRRSYDLRAVEPQSLRGYSIGGLAIDHYVGDGDADCDSCELLRLKLDSFEIVQGRIPRCFVEILANGVSSPNRADYVRGLLRSKPADLSALLPTDWFFGSNIYKPVSASGIKG